MVHQFSKGDLAMLRSNNASFNFIGRQGHIDIHALFCRSPKKKLFQAMVLLLELKERKKGDESIQ